jgi:hypothetical protein
MRTIIRIKNCMNWYKNHTLYEFVLYNMYNFICMNSYKKLVKKRFASGLGFKPRTKWLAIVAAAHHPPPPGVPIFLYHTIRLPSTKADYTI